MTIGQAVITWVCFIVAAAATGVGVVSIVTRRRDRKRGRSFDRHTHEALAITQHDRNTELAAIEASWALPTRDRADS